MAGASDTTGDSRSTLHALRPTIFAAPDIDRQVIHNNPAQAVRPSGRPMPQMTMLISGNRIGVRPVHCSAGGPPPLRLDSAADTANAFSQSGFGVTVKRVVSPVVALNDIG